MMYLLDIDVTWDDETHTTYRVRWEADNLAQLKEKFEAFIFEKAYDIKPSTFSGTVNVKRYDIINIGTKPFTGTFQLTETMDINFT
jgi:hypothetical protein